MSCAVVALVTNLVMNMVVANCAVDRPPEGTYLVEIQEGQNVGIDFVYDPETNTFKAPQ